MLRVELDKYKTEPWNLHTLHSITGSISREKNQQGCNRLEHTYNQFDLIDIYRNRGPAVPVCMVVEISWDVSSSVLKPEESRAKWNNHSTSIISLPNPCSSQLHEQLGLK